MTPQIEDVLEELRRDAATFKRTGQERQFEYWSSVVDKVAAATEDYRRYLSEEDAVLRSAKSVGWLRSRFAEWERQGNAKRDGKRRLYRQVIVPMRANPSAARAAGRAA